MSLPAQQDPEAETSATPTWRGLLARMPRDLARRAGRWALAALVVVLALVGFFFVTRGTAVQHVRGVGADGAPIAPSEPPFALSVALLTGTPMSTGNRVELALDGDGTFPRLFADLRSATRSILFQNYYAKPGRVADSIVAILGERARAGVRVLVLHDAFGSQDLGSAHFDALRAAGARVVPFRPLALTTLWRVQNRSHVRAIVVDGRVGWTGGFGIDDKWLGDGRTGGAWRETNVRFEGPAVLQLVAAFAAAWTEATGVMVTGRSPVVRDSAGGAMAGLLYAAPTLGSTPAERFLALSIAGARRSLYITNAYFAPDDNFVALLAATARRGVDVRLLVGGPRTDIRMTWQAGRARYAELLEAGVRIYEWQPSTLHAKTFVVDGLWSTIGTMNFDNRSLALNDEVTLMVLDPDVGHRMNALFMDDLRWAREITAEEFARRPWTERVSEWAADQLTRLL